VGIPRVPRKAIVIEPSKAHTQDKIHTKKQKTRRYKLVMSGLGEVWVSINLISIDAITSQHLSNTEGAVDLDTTDSSAGGITVGESTRVADLLQKPTGVSHGLLLNGRVVNDLSEPILRALLDDFRAQFIQRSLGLENTLLKGLERGEALSSGLKGSKGVFREGRHLNK